MQDGVDAIRDLGIALGIVPPLGSEITKREFGGAILADLLISNVISYAGSKDPGCCCRQYIAGIGVGVHVQNSVRLAVGGRR
jgi:hypothetical protein